MIHFRMSCNALIYDVSFFLMVGHVIEYKRYKTEEQFLMENNPNNVFAAFEILLEALETEIDSINQVGARAQQHRDYKGANAAISRALQATELLEKVESLCEDWEALIAIHRDNLEVVATSVERQNPVRLHQGQQTPEKDFCKPILKALRDLDGSARTKDALKKVELSMK